jgi:NMD protein affecting ribosome stability and mRNA decay
MEKSQRGRKDRLIKQKRHDVYLETTKLPEPTLCPECHALFVTGRWTWKKAPEKVYTSLCPACRRISDNYPAGLIEIKGTFYQQHTEEILNLVRNIESQEKGERPLERIMTISDEKDHTLVKTTGIHIARRIGEALSRSYKGNLTFQYADSDKNIRVNWQRWN